MHVTYSCTGMFSFATAFNRPLTFDTSSVTNMSCELKPIPTLPSNLSTYSEVHALNAPLPWLDSYVDATSAPFALPYLIRYVCFGFCVQPATGLGHEQRD